MNNINLQQLTALELLRIPYAAIRELINRGIVRTQNSPLGDYTEYLVAEALGGELEANSKKSYDIATPDGITYQVKGRRMTGTSGDRQLSVIRSWEFDYLIGVLFDVDLNLVRAAKVPMQAVKEDSYTAKHANGQTFYLRDTVWDWDGVEDITDLLLEAHNRL